MVVTSPARRCAPHSQAWLLRGPPPWRQWHAPHHAPEHPRSPQLVGHPVLDAQACTHAHRPVVKPSSLLQFASICQYLLEPPLVLGRSILGVNLPACVKRIPNPCLTPRILRPPCRRPGGELLCHAHVLIKSALRSLDPVNQDRCLSNLVVPSLGPRVLFQAGARQR